MERRPVREADALDLEADGVLPGPARRAPLDDTNPAHQVDQGDFIDGTEQHGDVTSPADTFPRGPKAGQEMPEGLPGTYQRATFEADVAEVVVYP